MTASSTQGASSVTKPVAEVVAAKPVPAKSAALAPRPAGRRVRLTLSRIDPWSAMKVSFLVAVGLGIATVVMIAVLWMLLSGMGVFDQVNSMIEKIIGDADTEFNIMDFVGFGKIVSISIVLGVINVLLITALATLGAFLYNVCASLVGGLQLTLTDD